MPPRVHRQAKRDSYQRYRNDRLLAADNYSDRLSSLV